MAIVKHVKLYFDICDSHMSPPFNDGFVTPCEHHTVRTLDNISSSLIIWGTGTVKWVMFEDTYKAYNMIVEAYCVPELKHRLVSPQDIHTEKGYPMYFQNNSGLDRE